jgi:CheY-like chemotaxis protein
MAHILLVEDNPRVLAATSLLLERAGHRVTTATSVAEAAESTRVNPDLDLVITDYRLSGDDTGKQVISAVRGLRGATFNAIVLTGDTSSAVHDFDGDNHLCWLRKPANSALLLSMLQNFTPPS